jgi:Holliday junction resolvasome RuvABC endonuclease subunit
MRLLAIDPSLVCSGWALFHDSRLVGLGKIRSEQETLSIRLARIQNAVTVLFEKCDLRSGDILVCEGPTTMRDPSAAIKVEQVRGIFECVARGLGVQVPGRINPRTVHKHILGMRGSQMSREIIKSAAAQSVQLLFAEDLARLNFDFSGKNWKRYQDVLDAILIGYMAHKRIEAAQISGLPLGEVFEPSKPRKPRYSASSYGGTPR